MPKITHLTGADNPRRAVLVNRGPAGLRQKLKPEVSQLGNGQAERLVVTPVPNGQINNIRCDGEVVDLSSLVPDPNNARLHGERNLQAIKDSLNLYGQLEPLVVRKQNRMIAAGNGRREAMLELGWTKCAITMRPMTDLEFHGFALADNRTAELATWNLEMMAMLKKLHPGMHMPGWSSDEITAMLLSGVQSEADPEEAPEPPKVPISQPGDLWILGDHRLICGDAEDAEVVARLLDGAKPFLMVTDPPYGVSYDPEWRHEAAAKGLAGFSAKRGGKVENDDRSDWTIAWNLFPGSVAYCWHAGRYASTSQIALENAGFEIRNQIMWAKDSFSISRGHYHWQHEPCYYAVRKGSTAEWCGDRSQSTLWRINKRDDQDQGGHAAQKPLDCMSIPIANHLGNVYDPFVGTGTTIIACQRLGRRCFAIELDPGYVDICLTRFSRFSGIDPTRESDGIAWSELTMAKAR